MFENHKTEKGKFQYMEGISVITPCYKGEKYIYQLLESMKKQKLSYDLFEHVIVINGELDGTPQIIEDFKEKNPHMNIKTIYSEIANASNARNIAIAGVNREYSTLIDADDYVSPNYLKELYEHASENRIVIASFFDVEESTGKVSHSYVTPELLDNSGIVEDPYNRLPHVLVINVCKLIPSSILKQLKFNTNLSSGEDIEFFCRLLTLFDPEFYVLNSSKRAVYYRILRSNSISRKKLSFQFNVLERLEVIKRLNDLLFITNHIEKEKYIQTKIVAQCTFIHNYISKYPDEIELVHEAIRKEKLNYFSFEEVNRNLAKKLVISHSSPPYIDTKGNKKKVEIVDVIHVDMEKKIYEKLTSLSGEYIDQNLLITTPYSYNDWNGIKHFCSEALKKLDQIIMKKGEYEEIYSRSIFPASHFLAFEYKIKYPDVKWIAEFSKSMSNDSEAVSKIDDPEFLDKVNYLLYNLCCSKCDEDNLLFLSEYLPYVFADEIVFTEPTYE